MASATVWGQNAPKLNARELFYAAPQTPPDDRQKTKAQKDKSKAHVIAAPVFLGLQYQVFLLGPGGSRRKVDPDTTFRSGDAIRVEVTPNVPGYLYAVTQGATGQWCLLFPQPGDSGGSPRVEARATVQLPPDPAAWRFDEHSGTEKLFVVLARQPAAVLEKRSAVQGAGRCDDPGTPPSQATIRDYVLSQQRQQLGSRDLVFVKDQNADYVGTTSTEPDARFVQDFALQHQ